MQKLSAQAILTIWERGLPLLPPERALVILITGLPDSPANLAELTLGQRNYRLLKLRELTFGNQMDCFVQCKQCTAKLHFTGHIDQLCQKMETPIDNNSAQELSVGEYTIIFRFLNSNDLLSAVKQANAELAKQIILKRCLLQIKYRGEAVAVEQLPEAALAEIEDKLQAADPYAEILFDLHCPDCTNNWQSPLDIASYIWEDIEAEAKRLLLEIHMLASVYGWNEEEILSLSKYRRKFYLNKVL